MPDAWPGIGEDSLLKILDGKKQTQIQAVWNYLSDGPRARTPVGVITQSMELIPTFEPIIYRNFIEGAGPRAIGVGYPEQMSLAFDANDLRLAMIWQGCVHRREQALERPRRRASSRRPGKRCCRCRRTRRLRCCRKTGNRMAQ